MIFVLINLYLKQKWIKEFLKDLFKESMALMEEGDWPKVYMYLTLAKNIHVTMEKGGYFGDTEEKRTKMDALKCHARACFESAHHLGSSQLPVPFLIQTVSKQTVLFTLISFLFDSTNNINDDD